MVLQAMTYASLTLACFIYICGLSKWLGFWIRPNAFINQFVSQNIASIFKALSSLYCLGKL